MPSLFSHKLPRRRIALLLTPALTLLIATVLVPVSTRASTIDYRVTVDTSTLPINSGLYTFYADMQFDPGPGARTVILNATNFTIADFGPYTTSGNANVSPPFDTPLTFYFDNGTNYNDIFGRFDVSAGTDFSFDLIFSGPEVDTPDPYAPSGSTFALSLFDPTGTIPLLTSDPNGFLALLTINPDATISTQTFPDANGGPSPVTLTNLNAPPPPPPSVPEPNTLLLLATGLAPFLARRTRKAK